MFLLAKEIEARELHYLCVFS